MDDVRSNSTQFEGRLIASLTELQPHNTNQQFLKVLNIKYVKY